MFPTTFQAKTIEDFTEWLQLMKRNELFEMKNHVPIAYFDETPVSLNVTVPVSSEIAGSIQLISTVPGWHTEDETGLKQALYNINRTDLLRVLDALGLKADVASKLRKVSETTISTIEAESDESENGETESLKAHTKSERTDLTFRSLVIGVEKVTIELKPKHHLKNGSILHSLPSYALAQKAPFYKLIVELNEVLKPARMKLLEACQKADLKVLYGKILNGQAVPQLPPAYPVYGQPIAPAVYPWTANTTPSER
jgi:hypothetical protein